MFSRQKQEALTNTFNTSINHIDRLAATMENRSKRGLVKLAKQEVGSIFTRRVSRLERNFTLSEAHIREAQAFNIAIPYHLAWAIIHSGRAFVNAVFMKRPQR